MLIMLTIIDGLKLLAMAVIVLPIGLYLGVLDGPLNRSVRKAKAVPRPETNRKEECDMLLDQNVTETKLAIDQQRADELARKINSVKYLSCKNWATLKTVKTSEGPDTREYHEFQVPFDYLSDAVELDSIRLQYRNNPDYNLDTCKIKYRVISAKTDGSIQRWYDIGGLHYTEFTVGDWEYYGPDGRLDDTTLFTRFVFAVLSDEAIQKAIYLDGGFRLLDEKGNMFPGKLILSPYPTETSDAIIYPVDHIKLDSEQ